MRSSRLLLAVLVSGQAVAADFSFTLRGSSEVLTVAAVKSASAVETCVGKQTGPVVALLFVAHEGLFVEVRSAPKGTEECIAKVLRAMDVSGALPHETVTIVAGFGTSSDLPVVWPSMGLEVIDQDEVTAMPTAFDRRERASVKEGFAHGALLHRCKPGEYVVMLAVSQAGKVTRVTGTRDACVTSVLEGMRFPEKGTVRLKLRLD